MKIRFIACLLLILLSRPTAAQQDDFKIKGFHLDLRIQVMKMPALKAFVLNLGKHGINTLVMEWEASYPYEKHAVISNSNAYTRKEITDFIRYCDSLHIDVIPLQQSFGHVEYILRHQRYKDLREDQKDYSQVNPTREAACKALFTDLFSDMISTHHSKYLHIGGDETYLLGHSPESKAKADSLGKGRLYGDYIKMLCELVVKLGKTPLVWADIALKYPDALKGLPKETIFIDWNYGWDLNRFGDHEKLMQSGFEIWGSPALRSGPDNYYLTDWDKHFNNIRTFIPQARQMGYKGIVMTSWSTSGIYDQVFESATEMTDMVAVRRVYPVSGFDMLVSAYLESLHNKQPLDIGSFVNDYTRNKFGFTPAQARRFYKALTRAPYDVSQGRPVGTNIALSALLDSARLSGQDLRQLTPAKNKSLWQHYLLMSDIRIFYLACMQVQEVMNSDNYTADKASMLLRQLQALDPGQLDQRFGELNKELLYPSDIALENAARNARYQSLIAKLTAHARR